MSISVLEPEHAQALDDRRSWRAVCERDRSQDGRFVYAVASTRVYCRPSCAARRPRRGQVTFYTRPEEAERAGYRACRRCDPRGTSPEEFQSELIRAACRELELDPTRRVTLEDLGSTNGTFLRRSRVRTELALEDGDEIKVGTVVLTIRLWASDKAPHTKRIRRRSG